MSNFGFGFNRGQFGGGMRLPFGGGGAAGQGGFQPRPFQGGMQVQQRPGFPGLQSNYRTLLHRPNQPPVQQVQRAARPMAPPATRGAGMGTFGANAAQQGAKLDVTKYLEGVMSEPGFQPGFLSIPPEPTRPTMPPSLPGRPQMNNVYGVDGPGPGDNSPVGDDVRQRVYGGGQTGQGLTPQQIQQRTNMGGPAVGASSSFANTPARQWTPLEQATMNRFEADQAMNQLQDANPNYRDNLAGSMERDRGIIERGMVPDVNDPNFRGITPQQAFQQIPGNPFNVMGNRFSAINANRSPNVQDQSAMDGMTASQTTTTMPKYSDRYAAAEAENLQKNPEYVPVDANGPAYRIENGQVTHRGSITPMPRAGGQLTPEEFRRMQAVGSSVGEWMKKSQWLSQKYPNHTGEMTPEQAQAYTAEQQQKRLAQNDMIHQNKMKRIGQAEQIREAKSRQAGQLFQRNNPGLFSDMNLTAAQLAYGLAGGDLRQFQQAGVTPAQALSAQLQNNSNQANLIAQMPEGEAKDRAIEAYQRGQLFGGSGLGGIPNAPPTGGGWSGSNNDEYNRDDTGRLKPGKMAEKLSRHLFNPNSNPTAQDLINDGINPFTLAELEQNFQAGVFSDPATHQSMREMIARAKKILGSQGQAAGGQGAGGVAATQVSIPTLPPAVPPSPGPGGRWGNPYGPSF